MSTFVLPLSDVRATLDCVGGKGMSLARLVQLGMPVPDGFHITTEAYRRFVSANGLQRGILSALQGIDDSQPQSLDAASAAIGSLFAAAPIPQDVASAICQAYTALPASISVAVRSSATAEDLPDASFAGQQETYLNIRGAEALLVAVRNCWASLWTGRAIAYRARQGIAPESVALAVVVQQLVYADAAGVMFTANPFNGSREQVVITAAWGLGEAVVSGQVTPDTLTVDKATGRMLRREIADKQVMTLRTDLGIAQGPVARGLRKKAVLGGRQARELAAMGAAIEKHYGSPMDIEWARADGRFAIVQARPVTALPDEGMEDAAGTLQWPIPHPKAMLARGSFAEFVPEPVSPLFATLAVPLARTASMRMMGDIGMAGKDSYLFSVINDYVYVGFVFTPRFIWKMTVATITAMGRLLKDAAQRGEVARADCLAAIEPWRGRDLTTLRPIELLEGVQELFRHTADFYTVAQSGAIPAATMAEMTFSKFYDLLVRREGDPDAPKFLFGSENYALRAEKALYDLAVWVRERPALKSYIEQATATALCMALEDETPVDGWGEFTRRFRDYLNEYGHAIYDLDFAKPLPAEDPAPLLETLQIYLQGQNSPYERQQAAITFREQAAAGIARRLDPLRRKYFRKLMKSAMETAPQRENSIAELGLCHPQMRRILHELGARLSAQGAIAQANDIYWLELSELEGACAALERGDALARLTAQVAERRSRWEAMRRIAPPTTLPKVSWMSRFMPTNEGRGRILKGFAASAGRVTGRACVMLGPEDFGRMQTGDVIVAGITTPAWTPLFARAAAIVTDIGGPLSHSSIVAREYGIPAVLATGVGTRRIRNGQTVVVDGSAGTVTLMAP